MESEVRAIIDGEIQPGLAGDGLGVELVSVSDDGIVNVRFHGLAPDDFAERWALQVSILQRLKEDLPDLKNVVSEP
jgi:Fe-S cluster biogenesis protein NfuA